MGRRTKRGKKSRASFGSVLMMQVHVLDVYWTLVVRVYSTRAVRLYVKSGATRRNHTQLVRLELQISCSNQLSYTGAAHMKAGLASSSRVRPTIVMHDE